MKKSIPSYWLDIFDIVKSIPEGRVTTYGLIADYLALGSARMVGWALNASHTYEDNIPAHRVVNRKGELSGRHRFPTPTYMEEALISEGIEIINGDTVKDFKKIVWHPENLA